MELAFWVILAVLFILACIIGVVALYLSLKRWAWEEMEIVLPPKTKPQESYWETLQDGCVTLVYVCNNCNGESNKKYAYCPTCGIRMRNYDKQRK